MTRLKSLVHQVAKENNPEAEKQYFYTKFVAVPALQRLLKAKIKAFNEESKEKVSLKIDPEFIKKTFNA